MLTETLRRPDVTRVELEIDHVAVAVPEGVSVLRAAELAGVPIPALCSHKELSSFGGCRLCTVEIAGMRGYPLACSTEARTGMQVTTDTVALREMREEVLQLILSTHPASCLLCDDKDGCTRNQVTIRKAGVSTGCRSCSKDGVCELQKVVEQVGLTELEYPVAYRGLEPEHDDPFYDRDYNLCILCGRCVRMCHEVRGASVLSFKYRGPRTLIGPAFGASHAEAGCEFCGACVTVCPTGALADKVSKWDGEGDAVITSTCPFCGLGCQLEVGTRAGRLSWATGAHDEQLNDGQLCVRGRFCLPETTHHYERARKPLLRAGRYDQVADWEEALDEVAAMLAYAKPEDVLMLVSVDLTNEGLWAAQRFARAVIGTAGLDSSEGARLPGGAAVWSRLFGLPISLEQLGRAEAVIVAGLDSRFAFSVAGVQARRAVRRGGTLVVVDGRESNLVTTADLWLAAPPGEEARVLMRLLRAVRGLAAPSNAEAPASEECGIADAARALAGAHTLAVVVGPRVFDSIGGEELPAELEAIAGSPGVTVLPLWEGANVRGALELGGFAGVLPGPRPGPDHALTLAQVLDGARPSVIYLVGEAPFTERPDCDFLIAQDLYQPPFAVDAFLPAASFAEADGTLTNLEGRVQELRGVETVDDDGPRPDWRIFADLAGRLGRDGFGYPDVASVRAAIRADVKGYPAAGDRRPRRMAPLGAVASPASPSASGARPDGSGRFLLVPEPSTFRHRGIDLGGVVEGLGELAPEQGLRMNAEDVARIGAQPGGDVTVTMDGVRLALPVKIDPACPRGAVYVTTRQAWGGRAGDDRWPALEHLSRLPARPVRVRVTPGRRLGRPDAAHTRDASSRRKKGGQGAAGR